MTRITRYIGMAAIALMGSVIMGCSENDLVENTPKGGAVTLTTTISLDSSAGTRALDAAGHKTLAANDQIAFLYKDASDKSQKAIATLAATDISSDGKTAKITVTLNNPKASGQLRCIYPAAMLGEDFSVEHNSDIDDVNTINYLFANNQDGTLETISSKYDLAIFDGTFTSDAGLPASIALTNRLAIVAFTIKDYAGTSDLTNKITGLTVKVGADASALTYTVARTAADGPIYVAMFPCSASDITVTATDGTNAAIKYEKTVTSKTLAASTITPVTAKMQKIVDLAKLTSAYEAQDGDILTGTLGTKVMISIAAGATVTLKDANINMKDDGAVQWTDGSYAGITCIGNATIILEGTNRVYGFADGYPGIQAAYNGSGTEYTLTIQGKGSLTAIGTSGGAGIGCGNGGKCGNITIEGGTIKEAKGGENAAGIGSGNGGTCGNITISGGEIKEAKGDNQAAGIGSGFKGSCGDITISGGEIKQADGGFGDGAGIGSGYGGTCGNITISGGTTTAWGGPGAAGIGSGSGSTCGDITISGGTTTAWGGAAGIGSGNGGNCGAITITTGITLVTATRGSGANCIGKGKDSSTCGIIKFGETQVFDGATWAIDFVNGNYGGLKLAISTKIDSDDTWMLTPVSSN